MKGLRHNVIEINDTNNDNIDRILVFLKPQAADVAIAATREQAAQLLQELEIKKVKRFERKHMLAAAAAAALLLTLCLIIVL